MTQVQCAKCGRALSRGFVLDQGDHSRSRPSRWIEGEPVRSFWLGLKLRGRRQLPLEAYRCEGCGFVELYANAAEAEI